MKALRGAEVVLLNFFDSNQGFEIRLDVMGGKGLDFSSVSS